MNQNSSNIKTILSQSLPLCVAILISLLLIILISNILIFPIIYYSAINPESFTLIVEIVLYSILITLLLYSIIYSVILQKKAGIPFDVTIKHFLFTAVQYIVLFFIVTAIIIVLIAIIYYLLKTNYILLYKLIH